MLREYYKIHDFRFSVATDCEEMKPCLALLYPAMAAPPGRCSKEWTVRHSDGGEGDACSCQAYEDDNLICETGDMGLLLETLERAVTMQILQNTRHYIQLHAAGVVAEGTALLLVGPPGSGKTSLALGMLLKGWKCLSDEVILIDGDGEAVMPFARTFHVGSGTLDLFPHLTAGLKMKIRDGSGKMLLDPALVRNDWLAGPAVPVCLVFPSYRPDNRNDLVPIGETEAMTLLIGQTINLLEHGDRGLQTLLGLVRSCRCFRFNTGDMHEASHVISMLMEQQSALALR